MERPHAARDSGPEPWDLEHKVVHRDGTPNQSWLQNPGLTP